MCGRITNHQDLDRNARDFDADVEPLGGEAWRPSYNIAPTQPLPVLGLRDDRRVVRVLRWGLIPSWSKDRDMAARCVNARAESVADRPAFREAFGKRRCAVLVTGWYEWKTTGGVKVPHWFHDARGGGDVIALAGLWERWVDVELGREQRTCAVITCASNAQAAAVHDRMPVVLDAESLPRWLAHDAAPDALHALLHACAEGVLGVWPVGRGVGDVRSEGAGLIVRAA